MTPSDELHALIISLTQSEKRFVKIHALRHVIGEQNAYILLFDAIAAQPVYDEEAIKIKLKGTPILHRFATAKMYLHRHILKSMRIYHSDNTIDLELAGMLHDIDFLYQKGLYKQSKKLHRKAEKLATESDKKIRLLEILEWKAKLLQVENKDSGKTSFHKEVFSEEETILKSIRQGMEIKSDVLDVFSIIRKQGFARTRGELSQIREVLKKYSTIDEHALSFNDRYYLNYIKTVYHTSSGNHEKGLLYTTRNVELLESMPAKLQEEEFERYIVSLNNVIVNLIHLDKTKEASPYIEKIRSLATRNIRENMLLWLTSYKLVLGVSIRAGDYLQAEKIVSEIENGIDRFGDKIPVGDVVLFKYNMAVVHFTGRNYSPAIRLLNEIINHQELALRDDIQSYARLVRLIIFWEKGEQELLPSATISAYRFLFKRKKLFRFETLVLNFIREKVPDMNTAPKQKKAFLELKSDLEDILADPLEKKVLDYFDFLTWVESKISRKDFRSLLKEKSEKRE